MCSASKGQLIHHNRLIVEHTWLFLFNHADDFIQHLYLRLIDL